ncbi:hypothetical protein [Absidia glauca]|uniref:Uncharacterized protein n=1 Tax=Absidia glauca TaxID=4829 RepID=A0A168TBW5_ABSGL|nr:hypothetical protein [Absidia glauca]
MSTAGLPLAWSETITSPSFGALPELAVSPALSAIRVGEIDHPIEFNNGKHTVVVTDGFIDALPELAVSPALSAIRVGEIDHPIEFNNGKHTVVVTDGFIDFEDRPCFPTAVLVRLMEISEDVHNKKIGICEAGAAILTLTSSTEN